MIPLMLPELSKMINTLGSRAPEKISVSPGASGFGFGSGSGGSGSGGGGGVYSTEIVSVAIFDLLSRAVTVMRLVPSRRLMLALQLVVPVQLPFDPVALLDQSTWTTPQVPPETPLRSITPFSVE